MTGIRWRKVNDSRGIWRVQILIDGKIHLNHFTDGGNSEWTADYMRYLDQWKLPLRMV